jgi:hypothetical protein
VKDVGPVEGLTVTTMSVTAPGHVLAAGVTLYVTVPGASPGFVSVCAIVVPFEAVAPYTPPVTAPIVQLKVVPDTVLVSSIFVGVALQIVVGLVVETLGVGLTVTTMLTGLPGHAFANGVTMYVTVPAVDSGLVRTCEIVVPDDAVAPVIPPVIAPTVQLKVAPATLLVSAILVVVPLQIVVGLTVVAFGVG